MSALFVDIVRLKQTESFVILRNSLIALKSIDSLEPDHSLHSGNKNVVIDITFSGDGGRICLDIGSRKCIRGNDQANRTVKSFVPKPDIDVRTVYLKDGESGRRLFFRDSQYLRTISNAV